jgi:tRNA pseudouridine55 synthase
LNKISEFNQSGIFLINKKENCTSFSVIRDFRKKFNISKVGHAGTLDSFASGLLIILVNKATKLSGLLTHKDKTYSGIIGLNKMYDSYEYTGNLIKETNTIIDESTLDKTINSFIGSYYQTPPLFSAKKVNGKRASDLMRENKEVTLKSSLVNIYDFKRTSSLESDKFSFFVSVSKGTYIRSLAYDLGIKLFSLGYLSKLVRLSIDKYSIEMSKDINDLTLSDMISIEDLFISYDKIEVDELSYLKIYNGNILNKNYSSDYLRIYYNLNLVAIYYYSEDMYKMYIKLC